MIRDGALEHPCFWSGLARGLAAVGLGDGHDHVERLPEVAGRDARDQSMLGAPDLERGDAGLGHALGEAAHAIPGNRLDALAVEAADEAVGSQDQDSACSATLEV